MLSIEQIREGYVQCALAEHNRNIHDTQWVSRSRWKRYKQMGLEADDLVREDGKPAGVHEGDRGEIARIIRSSGGYWERKVRKEGYIESKGWAWCGFFITHCMRNLGDFIDEDMCYDVTLHSKIGSYVLPSTYRINSKSFWEKGDVLDLRIDGTAINPMHVQRGDILCITTSQGKPYGDHYVMCLGGVVEIDGEHKFPSISGNGYGWINKKWGEGVELKDESYRPDLMHDVEDIKRVYRFDKKHFIGSAVG